MVLSLMRKHAKSWLIKFLIAIIALVFIFYFGYSFTSEETRKVAKVNGEVITGTEYQKAYRDMLTSLQRQYKDFWDDNLLEKLDLKNRVLQNLIDQKLIAQEAERLGLEVTEQEVQQTIMEYPAFQTDGRFDMRRYETLLAQNRMNPEDFEQGLIGDLMQQKLRRFLFAFMAVTDQEVRDEYVYTNEKVKVSYVVFNAEDFKDAVEVDQKAMESYFKKNREKYRVPDKIKACYLTVDPDRFKDQVKVNELEIREYYEYNTDQYSHPEQVRARHILIRVDEDATEAEERARRGQAKEILEQAREGAGFVELAKKYSEDPSASQGGDLGYFSEGEMVEPVEKAAFGLKPGEISDLVRSRYGYHIIKVEDVKEAKTESLEEVQDDIVEKLTADAAADLAHERGLSLVDQMPYEVDLPAYAEEQGYAVEYTDYFSRYEPTEEFGRNENLHELLFALDEKETSDLRELEGKFYIFQVVDKKSSFTPEMSEVSEELKEDAAASLAAESARSAAAGYLAQLKGGKDWEELAEEKAMKVQETDFFTREEAIPGVGRSNRFQEEVFRLGEENRYLDPIYEGRNGAFVIRWEARKGIDEERFQEEKEETRASIRQKKHGMAFRKWLEEMRGRAKIEILTSVDSW